MKFRVKKLVLKYFIWKLFLRRPSPWAHAFALTFLRISPNLSTFKFLWEKQKRFSFLRWLFGNFENSWNILSYFHVWDQRCQTPGAYYLRFMKFRLRINDRNIYFVGKTKTFPFQRLRKVRNLRNFSADSGTTTTRTILVMSTL